ncbi:MAG: hypothetical protein EOM37_04045 [Proteobacteria bacterium]|jgi:hypothetical protein|nr:HEPN family nuclease [Alphaproteobacteria bacterium]NCC03206.1 hypothetical protein [Pseudomonadota bacterium]
MNQGEVVQIITSIRQGNGLLAIIDQEKNNPLITLGEIHGKFQKAFGISPAQDGFAFFNQNQFITSLFAYVCLPNASFYEELPKTNLKDLPKDWGVEDLECADIELQELIRRMRNSIAHGDVEVTPDLQFTFKFSKSPIVFNAHNIQKFCQALAFWAITKDIKPSGLYQQKKVE